MRIDVKVEPTSAARSDLDSIESHIPTREFIERVRINQQTLRAELKPQYDFIVCGSGSSGSVVARRLAENPDVSVLLLEAGGSDDVPSVVNPSQWVLNMGSERDWGFVGESNPHLHGRSTSLNMGKVLGGGSSINTMVWARGHRCDWDLFADEAGDSEWNYESVLNLFHRIEDWHGESDPEYRGTGGQVFVQPAPNPNPIAPAMVQGSLTVGIPSFENQNGRMMEGDGGASIIDLIVRDGKRQSIFRSYVFPYMDRPNLTVLTHALVTRLTVEKSRATGVEIVYAGKTRHIAAGVEIILSLGAMHTPKVLMLSGIGEQDELRRCGIPLMQHLPGVGQNYQNHFGIGCIWEYHHALPPRNNAAEGTFFWKSDPRLVAPDLQTCQVELPFCSPEAAAKFDVPGDSWTLFGGVVQAKSRGRIRLSGSSPFAPIETEDNMLSHSDDLKAAIACVELCREIGNSIPLRPFAKREVMPGNLKGAALESFVRDAATPYAHQTCTAKMGRDSMSVVDGNLKVYGIDNLRIADGSIMPRVTTGNTMAPCVVIGERASDILRLKHKI
jgi:choline dehydrogenase